MRERGVIDLSIGGDAWAGFRFGSYGRARDWRILTPDGDHIQAGELVNLRGRLADLAFLQAFSREQAAKLAGSTLAFTRDESHLLRVALQLLLRELPVNLGRRDAAAGPALLLRAV